MGYFRKKITESEFAKALTSCTETARKAYNLTCEYQREVESILKELNTSLDEKISPLLNSKDAEHFDFHGFLKNMVAKLQKQSNNRLKHLKDAIETKSKHLEDFTITLFGRTKAGKSTIRESLTKSGDGSTIGLGYLHTTKEVGDYKWKGLRILDTPGIEGYGGEKEAEKAFEVIDQTDIVIFLTTDESQQPGEFGEMEKLLKINKPFFVVLNVKDKLTDPAYLQRFFNRKARLFDSNIIEEHKQRVNNETRSIGIYNVNIVPISALASCIAQFAERGFTYQNREDFLNSIKHEQIRPIIKWFLENLTTEDTRSLWQLSNIDEVYEQIANEVNIRGRQRRVLTFLGSTINYIDIMMKILWNDQSFIRAQAIFMIEKQWELECFFDGLDFKGSLEKLMSGKLTEGKAKFLKWKLNRYVKRVQGKISAEDSAFVKERIGDLRNLVSLIEKRDKKIFDLIRIFEKYLPRRKGFVEECEEKIETKCRELFHSVKEWVPDFVDEYLDQDNAQSVLKRRFNKEKERIEKEMKALIDEIVSDLKAKLHEFSQQYQYDIGTIKIEPSDIGDFRKGQMGEKLEWAGVALISISDIAFYISEGIAAENFWNPVGWIAAGAGIAIGFLSWLFSDDEDIEWLKAKKNAKKRLWDNIDKWELKTRGAYKIWFYKNITTKGRKEMFEKVSTYINGLFAVADDLKKYALQLRELQNQVNKELFTWLLQLEGVKCSEKDILSIAREQGKTTKIMVPDNWYIDGRIKTNLDKLCGEHILLFNDSNDIRERVARALYPAKLSLNQIEIIEDNGQKIAKIKVTDKEKGLCIGKNGVNIRLASQVCGVKIEIV